jgi:hypothetical protein
MERKTATKKFKSLRKRCQGHGEEGKKDQRDEMGGKRDEGQEGWEKRDLGGSKRGGDG